MKSTFGSRIGLVAFALAILAACSGAGAEERASTSGPFGLPMGATLGQLEGLIGTKLVAKGEGHSYQVDSPPKKHPRFERLNVVVTPRAGLCKIGALTSLITSSSQGREVIAEFSRIQAELDGAYGGGESVDTLLPGSIWDEPEDWMMGLAKKERILRRFWTKENGSKMKHSVDAISLEAISGGRDSAALLLRYDFENSTECAEELKRLRSSVL